MNQQPATEKQIAYLNDLLKQEVDQSKAIIASNDKLVDIDREKALLALLQRINIPTNLSRTEASQLIDALVRHGRIIRFADFVKKFEAGAYTISTQQQADKLNEESMSPGYYKPGMFDFDGMEEAYKLLYDNLAPVEPPSTAPQPGVSKIFPSERDMMLDALKAHNIDIDAEFARAVAEKRYVKSMREQFIEDQFLDLEIWARGRYLLEGMPGAYQEWTWGRGK